MFAFHRQGRGVTPEAPSEPRGPLRAPRAGPLPLLPFPSRRFPVPCPCAYSALCLPAPCSRPHRRESLPHRPRDAGQNRPAPAARPTRPVPVGVSPGGPESARARKWDVLGQQLRRALVGAEAALCGCIILNVMRNQTLIYCCPQAWHYCGAGISYSC